MKLTQIIHCEENITYGVTENSQEYDSLRALCNAIMYIKCSESRETPHWSSEAYKRIWYSEVRVMLAGCLFCLFGSVLFKNHSLSVPSMSGKNCLNLQ